LASFHAAVNLPSRSVTRTVPLAVVIPTYNRGSAVLRVLEKIYDCQPEPSEIWVHIDLADGELEREVNRRFPEVGILTSTTRLGPGGGRHKCLQKCTTPYAVSFDDDSYPVDRAFFSRVQELFDEYPQVAIFGASIWHRNEIERPMRLALVPTPSYIGCGYAVRLAAYRGVRGHLARPVPYGMEESDLSLQLFAAGWKIVEAGDLRVFHDTDLRHHESSEITGGSIANVGLFVYLHYPVVGWGWGLLQLLNKITYSIRRRRFGGICSGILSIPSECYRHRRFRKPVSLRTMRDFLRFCKTGAIPS